MTACECKNDWLAKSLLPLPLDPSGRSTGHDALHYRGDLGKGAARPATTPASDHEAVAGTKRRFSATRLATHRAKLGLSAASYGQLVGVSGQTIYHWEQGKARPRATQLENLTEVRELGAREIAERLSAE